MMKRFTFACVAVSSLIWGASSLQASMIYEVGASETPMNHAGKFFIPLQGSTSGLYGLAGGIINVGNPLPKPVGTQGDKVKLSGVGSTSIGDVEIVLHFDAVPPMDSASAQLELTLTDLDFLTEKVGKATNREWIELALMPGLPETTQPPAPQLTIDNTNYGDYRPDGFGKTNNKKVTYSIGLQDDLGLTISDFDAINSDGGFTLFVTAHSILTRTANGSATYRNTPEHITTSLTYTPVPEPATLTIIALATGMILRRNRR